MSTTKTTNKMTETNLTPAEKLTLEFMKKQGQPVLKSHVGIQVGKRKFISNE